MPRDRNNLDPPGAAAEAPAGRDAVLPGGGAELLDDGQEEVFAYTAVANGLVEDPKAMGPDDLARAPKSPVNLTAEPDTPLATGPKAAPQSSSE